MEAGEDTAPHRPLLAGGELLTSELERSGGGGEPYHPQTFEQAVRRLSPQLQRLKRAAAETPTTLRGSRIVFEAKVLPNYLANSHFPKDLFNEADLVPVGTRGSVGEYRTRTQPARQRETKTYLLAGSEASLARFDALLRGEEPTRPAARRARESLRQFDLLRVAPVEETLKAPVEPSDEATTWEAVLHPPVDDRGRVTPRERGLVLRRWRELLAELDGELAEDYVREIGGLTFMPVRLPADAEAEAARFNPLRAIRPMPGVRPIPVDPLRVATTTNPAPDPPPGGSPQAGVRVAVFDGGIDADTPHFAPFVTVTDLTDEPPDPDAVAHGTLVTSTVLYGAGHEAGPLRTPEVGVDHYRVIPTPEDPLNLDLYRMLDRIERIVSRDEHAIVNLSLGPDLCVDEDDEPHAWTAKLDELARRLGVLFVSAAGNNGAGDAATGADRIQVPADMVNGLGVGACDAPPPDGEWARAPYSAVGPGRPGARMQPIGVAFGGVDARPFRGIAPGGMIGEACGTSFAAPTAAHGLASLAATLGQGAMDPHVLRAFAAHCAEPLDPAEPEQVGFGRLRERYDEVLECAPNEATVLYKDSIGRGQAMSLPFPLVESVVANRTLNLWWTIAFSAPTDPRDPVEYTQAGLEVAFRPHAETYDFRHPDTGDAKPVNVKADPARATRLMREGYMPSPLPKTRSPNPHRHEAQRRRDEGKWETVLRFGARKQARSLLRPQVTAVYLAREEGDLAQAPPLEFAMLLTMRAPRGVPLYDAVRANYQLLTPLRTELPLRLPS